MSTSQPGHRVNMAKKAKNPITTLGYAGFDTSEKKDGHRTPRVPPLYIAIPTGEIC